MLMLTLTLTGALHTLWAVSGPASASEPSTTLCWLLWESEYTVEPWPLSNVLSAGEDKSTAQSGPPNGTPTTLHTGREGHVAHTRALSSAVRFLLGDRLCFQGV